MTRSAIIEIDSTNIKRSTVPMNIFDAADGLRPSALIVANPRIAITADGPVTTVNIMTSMINVFICPVYMINLMISIAYNYETCPHSSNSTMATQSFLKNFTIPFLIAT